MRHYKTIIVGGGISGMACARRLQDHGEDFLLITEELGGRMRTTTDKVNFGASYVTTDYKHVLKYADKGLRLLLHDCHCNKTAERLLQRARTTLRLPIRDCYFFDEAAGTSLFNPKNLRHVLKLIRLYFMVRRFRGRLNNLRRRALNEEQAMLLREDPLLLRYARQSARDLVAECGFESIDKRYISPLVRSTIFCRYTHEVNAFMYLYCLMPFILPTYTADFRQTVRRLTQGVRRHIAYATVKKIRRDKRGFRITTSAGMYTADNVVLAAPHDDLHKAYPVPKPHKQASIYVINVSGKRKRTYDKRIVFFGPPHKITILWRQENGTDIIFSTVKQPHLSRYYETSRVLKRVYWKTAVIIPDHHWAKQDLGRGLYLASDYNIPGLEDAFITGVYAANRIMERTS